MQAVLLVIQLLVSIALVGIILLQRSEGGALGMGGGGGGGLGGLFSPRGAADTLTRTTTILAILFFCSSLGLTLLALRGHPESTSAIPGLSGPSLSVPPPRTLPKPANPQVPAVPTPHQ